MEADDTGRRGSGRAYDNIVTLNAEDQTLEGLILVGSDSTANINLSGTSVWTGSFSGEITAHRDSSTISSTVGTVNVTLSDTACWVLDADCTVTSISGTGTIDYNGHTLTVGSTEYSSGCPGVSTITEVTDTDTETDTTVTFTDVAEDAWYAEAVSWAFRNGVTSGYGEGTFQPSAALTRAMTVTFLWNLAGCPKDSSYTESFTDVDDDDWYSDAVKWAVANGITSGYGENTFQPGVTCTRGMIVTFLKNYAVYEGTYAAASASAGFSDVADTDWYAESVDWAYENEITSGYGEGTFQPSAACNRAMMVVFLYNYDNNCSALG